VQLHSTQWERQKGQGVLLVPMRQAVTVDHRLVFIKAIP
jgi:hypothetical protein